MTSDVPDPERGAVRIRIGVALVVVSWLPFGQVAIWLAGATGSQADRVRVVIWSIQIVIGLAGVAIAGKETIGLAKSVGWKKLPGAVWTLLRDPRNAPKSWRHATPAG
ncbi:MAG: hypothetical protein ACRDU4_20750 [Mycobacterium sp.]